MKKEPKYIWDQENGKAICIIYYKNTSFCGVAECNEVDKDFMSERTGTHIAYIRAYIDYLKHIKDTEALPKLEALKHLYGTMQHSKHFNPKSYEAIRLAKEIKNAEIDLDTIKELIDINKDDLRLYIEEKDKFYKHQRQKKAKSGQNS